MNQKFLKYFFIIGLVLLSVLSCSKKQRVSSTDIIIENSEMRFVISQNGMAKSLLHKSAGEECLMPDVNLPLFGITQDYPYDNENKLAFPAKRRTFGSNKIEWKGDKLIVNFERTDYEAIIDVKITDSYVSFSLNKLQYKMSDIGDKRKTKIDEFILLQIPVKNRTHFGEWLNILWDEKTAVNLLAVDPACMIDAYNRPGYKVFKAVGFNDIKLERITTALITTSKRKLLDVIDTVEHDYNLPLGVESRRSKEYHDSYYEASGVTPANIDKHIEYAKKGGFKQFVVYYWDFDISMGHFGWNKNYPNDIEDLKVIVDKIRNAGMLPGFHIHYNKAQITDPYVTPVPDSRLNLKRYFSLREDVDKNDKSIIVQEDPTGCTLDDDRRLLRLGNEIIAYESYTTTPPYKFLNCKRGYLNTTSVARQKGDILGLLDVDTWPEFIRFNQRTDIQDEVAKRLADIIDAVGFKFLYYDGAEDVPPPYWYNVSKAQLDVYNEIKTKQLFAEGAQKSHFSWHLLTRGNAFDDFPPEVFKEGIKRYPLAEAELISNDFSSIDFGWIHPIPPDSQTIGLQPDMLEYAESKAIAWNSVISLVAKLKQLEESPRIDDNLEVIRRWEKAKEDDFFSDDIRKKMRDPNKEFSLLINEKGDFELVEYEQIEMPEKKRNVRAFVFKRSNIVWVVYWHISEEGMLKLETGKADVHLFDEIGKEVETSGNKSHITVPIGKIKYLKFNAGSTKPDVVQIIKNSKLK